MNKKDFCITLIAGTGMFLSTLDQGVMNMILPALENSFKTNITDISWNIILYTLVLAGLIVAFGRISDNIGRIKVYSVGLIIFGISSLFAGYAFSDGFLITSRMIQGVGGAMLQATSAALITTLVSKKNRAKAIGMLGMIVGLGITIGPAFGGLILSFLNWRWVFWINVPFCIISFIGCCKIKDTGKVDPVTINIIGTVMFTVSIVLIVYAISIIPIESISIYIKSSSLILGLIMLYLFIKRETKISNPIIPVRNYKNPLFIITSIGTISFGGANAIAFLIPPFYLVAVMKLSVLSTGFICLCTPLGFIFLSPISGKLTELYGEVKIMILGLFIMLLPLVLLAILPDNTILYASLLILYGIGGGIFMTPNWLGIMKTVTEEKQGTIGAYKRMIQNVAIAVTVAIASIFIYFNELKLSWLLAVFLVIIALLSFLIPAPKKERESAFSQ